MVRPRGDQLTADITQHNTIDFHRHAAITPHNTAQHHTTPHNTTQLSLPRPGRTQDTRVRRGDTLCGVLCTPTLMMGSRAGAGAGLGLGNIECVSSPYCGAVVHRASPRTRRGLPKSLHITQRQEQQQRLGAAEMRCRYYSVIPRRNNISLHTQDQ